MGKGIDYIMPQKIGGLIRQQRKKRGLTLQNVADHLGVSKMTVSKWETGKILNIRRDKLIALSKLLDISPIAIINGADPDPDHRIDTNGLQTHLNYLLYLTDGLTEEQKTLIKDYVKLICKTGE